jgi:hypothetical protein
LGSYSWRRCIVDHGETLLKHSKTSSVTRVINFNEAEIIQPDALNHQPKKAV